MTGQQIPQAVSAFIDAVNRHDEQAFLDTFTIDGFVDDFGRSFRGRQAIKTWSDREFIGARGVLRPEETAVAEGTVTVTGDWRSTHANGRSRFVFQVAGDLIASMIISEG